MPNFKPVKITIKFYEMTLPLHFKIFIKLEKRYQYFTFQQAKGIGFYYFTLNQDLFMNI